ncbi:MAG: methylenetetrahydrofolate reductase C-terminal domain-containing protein [Chloroflexaceae bacterium]|jgi:methylenetetrahydrofolate reductase (NADPH)|nr:methylenetetrahydrofolate reductase C-terminal domain-containing protein [Chloroflexaceae bacterium]
MPDTHEIALVEAQARCPKRMLHGPCGGVRPGNVCEVDATLPCPYLAIADSLAWRLNAPLTPPTSRKTHSGPLAARLQGGGFALVAEVYAPDSADLSELLRRYEPLRGRVDAVNVADNALATPHTSALATAAMFERQGSAAILNMTCRDRNRIALQSDLLGAVALGVQHVFCITGDHPALGDHRQSRAVFELDSLELIAMARRLRDEGCLHNGRPLQQAPTYMIGAAGSPFSPPHALQAERASAKVAAGADFIQTQAVFDLALFRPFVRHMGELGALQHAWLIAGLAVVTTLEQALWLQAEVPGALVPEEFIALLRRTPGPQRRAAGLAYSAEMLAELRATPGVSGALLFPLGGDIESMGELIERAGG